jgi:hypothetical protein
VPLQLARGGVQRGQHIDQPGQHTVSVVAGFYRTCVIDGVLTHSPAEHVRRLHVSSDSPTLGLTNLQLEALLVAARNSPNRAALREQGREAAARSTGPDSGPVQGVPLPK